jgi:hypothetical protein
MAESDFQVDPSPEPRPISQRRPPPLVDPAFDPASPNDPIESLIPYRNPLGLTAYYLGVFSFIPCLGLLLGPAALVTGIMGLRYSKQVSQARGGGHAIAGIVCGVITSTVNWALLVVAVIGIVMRK